MKKTSLQLGGLALALSSAFAAAPALAALPLRVEQALLLIRSSCTTPGAGLDVRASGEGRLNLRLVDGNGVRGATSLVHEDVDLFTEVTSALQARQPFELSACTDLRNNEVISALLGLPEGVPPLPASRPAPTPLPVLPSAPPPPPPAAAVAPPPAPASDGFPRYQDALVRATGQRSSVANSARSTLIPVRIENLGADSLLIGHDSREAVTVVTDTGETTYNQGGCGIVGVRQLDLHYLSASQQQDPMLYTQVMPQGSVTLQLSCDVRTTDWRAISSLTANLPLIRLEGSRVVRFTVNLGGIPVNR
jgi:hypothetical protein